MPRVRTRNKVRHHTEEGSRELFTLHGCLVILKRYFDINPGGKTATISQDAAVLYGKEGLVQQVHNQRCQRIRELGPRKEHAIANHHTHLARTEVHCTLCCTRYMPTLHILLEICDRYNHYFYKLIE